MPSLEIIIRPSVPQNIRPAEIPTPAQVEDEQEQRAEISGRAGQVINLSHSRTQSFSKSRERETRRTFDVVRVHRADTPRSESEYWFDCEVAHKLTLQDQWGDEKRVRLRKPTATDNIEILSENNVRENT